MLFARKPPFQYAIRFLMTYPCHPAKLLSLLTLPVLVLSLGSFGSIIPGRASKCIGRASRGSSGSEQNPPLDLVLTGG